MAMQGHVSLQKSIAAQAERGGGVTRADDCPVVCSGSVVVQQHLRRSSSSSSSASGSNGCFSFFFFFSTPPRLSRLRTDQTLSTFLRSSNIPFQSAFFSFFFTECIRDVFPPPSFDVSHLGASPWKTRYLAGSRRRQIFTTILDGN